ncbi:MAG: UDP-GlcNAc:undecaprenyl-phosphate/decaprenyl-phosphate GlcNAc-phosphate transferase [Frankiaceae bacterium]|nr:UDP-GlcNAc:undecaprenyl-phosphate/decaprenyl-phosphate GlcNAc-phosphate transferase [Frankiaceae bacterium]MDQ1634555.1 UDP-GlcNAc:undecaprenyl-phosphate/decaprenyl-phosphate GlcNAc-phosphate transferase [Frankiaceae bacterium]MDQ1648388.1 UDP-GlcNAc:undecaprenyl-phosphate/decaprenyl-phosphate GlcNAc-phosphate transferase [Frankiaceae bacterium]
MREYALVFVVAAAVTFLVTPLTRRFALRIGALAEIRDRDVHAVPTPRLGGLAMFAGLAAGLLVAGQLPFLSAVSRDYGEPRAVLAAGFLICLLGAVDDRFGIDAITKLAGQVLAAGVMVLLGIQLSYALLPNGETVALGPETAVPLTILLTVVLVNALNFVDGLDGLAAGVAAIAALAEFAYSYQIAVNNGLYRATPATLIAVATAGVCIGFLPHNFYPARQFMGDSGSMLVGLLLAASVTSVTGQVSYGGIAGGDALPSLLPLAVPLMVLAVPFVDLALAVVRRTRAGRSPFSPDKQHLHHRLLEIGHSHVRAVLLMWMWAALLGFGGVLASFSNSPIPVATAFVLLTLLSLILVRYPGRGSGSSHRAAGRHAGRASADRTARPPVLPPNERAVPPGAGTEPSGRGNPALGTRA